MSTLLIWKMNKQRDSGDKYLVVIDITMPPVQTVTPINFPHLASSTEYFVQPVLRPPAAGGRGRYSAAPDP